ncbi:hypothetical protein LDK92_11435, partial [Staphylococcus epidermidis]|nr:hypothetical protein [Staphylococcus epidermidis]
NGYSDDVLVKLFISEIVHIAYSFLLKLYYKLNFATEPKITYHSTSEGYILQKLLITEVKDDHTMITIDNDKDFDDAHTMSYEATENGQDKKEKEDKDIDHL